MKIRDEGQITDFCFFPSLLTPHLLTPHLPYHLPPTAYHLILQILHFASTLPSSLITVIVAVPFLPFGSVSLQSKRSPTFVNSRTLSPQFAFTSVPLLFLIDCCSSFSASDSTRSCFVLKFSWPFGSFTVTLTRKAPAQSRLCTQKSGLLSTFAD